MAVTWPKSAVLVGSLVASFDIEGSLCVLKRPGDQYELPSWTYTTPSTARHLCHRNRGMCVTWPESAVLLGSLVASVDVEGLCSGTVSHRRASEPTDQRPSSATAARTVLTERPWHAILRRSLPRHAGPSDGPTRRRVAARGCQPPQSERADRPEAIVGPTSPQHAHCRHGWTASAVPIR